MRCFNFAWLSVAPAFVSIALGACSASEVSSSEVRGSVGSAELALSLPDGTGIRAVSYLITGPNRYSNTGDVPVGNSSEVKFQVGNIPASRPDAYTIALRASTSSGELCSGGPAMFGITPSETALISVNLRCGGRAATGRGNVRVDVGVVQSAACAEVDGLSAIPREINTGSSISLTGFSSLPASSTYAWTVSSTTTLTPGVFGSPSASSTSFLCTEPGTHQVTLTVSSGAGCPVSTEVVDVICRGPTVDPDRCLLCELMVCPMRLQACETVGDVEKCNDVVQCVRQTGCATSGGFSLADCFCGDGVDVNTCLGQQVSEVTGACKEIIAQGTESTNVQEIAERFSDAAYATGRAVQLLQCDHLGCSEPCRF